MSATFVLVTLLAAGAVRVWSADPDDPWNRIHALLFVRDQPVPVVHGWPDDEPPEFLFPADAGGPTSPAAILRLVSELEAEARSPHLQDRTLEARLLFQHDLWRAFDRDGERWPDLRAPLARLISRLALTGEERDRVRSNWGEIARGFDGLDPEMLAGTSGWRELRHVMVQPDGTTLHSQNAGFRKVFRRFVRFPPRRDLLPGLVTLLPPGSRVVLVESLVSLGRDGELWAAPLVTSVETRDTAPEGSRQPPRLRVLHVSRRRLAAGERGGGGLVELPQDALVRSGLSCLPHHTSLEPLRAVCGRCHGLDGRMLMTFREESGGVQTGGVLGEETRPPANTLEPEAVLRAKAATPEYRALAALLASIARR